MATWGGQETTRLNANKTGSAGQRWATMHGRLVPLSSGVRRSTGEAAAAKWSASPGSKVGRVPPRGAWGEIAGAELMAARVVLQFARSETPRSQNTLLRHPHAVSSAIATATRARIDRGKKTTGKRTLLRFQWPQKKVRAQGKDKVERVIDR